MIQSRVDIRKTLVEKELGSKLTYFEVLQLLVEQQEELNVQKSHLHETEAAIAAIRETRGQAAAEYRHTLSDELAKSEQKGERAGPGSDQGRAEDQAAAIDRAGRRRGAAARGPHRRRRGHAGAAPARGGAERQPARDRGHGVERDIGFVHAGQQAEIKVDTFNFTRYGLLHGEVLSVSQDAVIRDSQQDRADDRTPGAQNETSEPKGQELNYSARISLDRTEMQIDDRMVNLSPGMAVTVEIKTGSRNILSYLLSPLLRYRQESVARAVGGARSGLAAGWARKLNREPYRERPVTIS